MGKAGALPDMDNMDEVDMQEIQKMIKNK